MVDENKVVVDEDVIETEATVEKKTIGDKIVMFGKRNCKKIVAAGAVGVVAMGAVIMVILNANTNDLVDIEDVAEDAEV